MSRFSNIDDKALWDSILKIQGSLETDFRKAAKARKLSLLGNMASPLRQMHWYAGFLGLTDLADLAAGGAAFVLQLQKERKPWSVEFGGAIKTLLRRTRGFCDARPDEPSAGVFIDSDEAVLQGPELKRPIPVDDLRSLFRRRQIDVNRVSSCMQLSIGQDPAFSHAITVPRFAKKRHREERNLTLVYLDLDDQGRKAEVLAGICETAWNDSEILLHGPLAIPWKNYKSYKGKRPYFLLLDTQVKTGTWLKERKLDGRVIKEIKTAEKLAGDYDSTAVSAMPSAAPVQEPLIRETRVIIQQEAPRVTMDQVVHKIQPEEKTRKEKRRSRRRMRKETEINFPIAPKMILVVSAILISAIAVTSVVNVLVFQSNLSTRMDINNTSMSSIVAKQTENELWRLVNSANLLFQVGTEAGDLALVNDFFDNDPNLIYVGVPDTEYQYANRTWLRNNRIFDQSAVMQGLIDARRDEIDKALNNETAIFNASPLIPNLDKPVMAVSVPISLGQSTLPLLILTDTSETLAEVVRLQQGALTVIVNPDGEVLAHPDQNRILNGMNISGSAAYEKIFTEELDFGVIEFSETNDDLFEEFFGYFRLIDNFHLGVITTVSRMDAFSDIRLMMRLSLYFGLAILGIAIIGVILFARSITVPILEIYEATVQLKEERHFDVKVKPRTEDEVGALGKNFNLMVEDTKELMDQTGRFVNPDVATMIIERDKRLSSRAQKKDVTVFFSDIRGYTSKSEAMGDPQIILDNLSSYFKAMVPCVQNTGGTVDKFIGDAVMAVWGSMRDLDNHAESAIEGALQMRSALINFNLNRSEDNPIRPKFKIGCGLHSGEATVGLMGSEIKQEWAHMGRTVNLASRIEASTSDLKVDILISPETKSRVEGIYDLVDCGAVKYKGVEGAMHVYAVLGRMDDPHRPRSLDEMRALVGLPKPDLNAGGSGGKFEVLS